jgi:hypothetical protein
MVLGLNFEEQRSAFHWANKLNNLNELNRPNKPNLSNEIHAKHEGRSPFHRDKLINPNTVKTILMEACYQQLEIEIPAGNALR